MCFYYPDSSQTNIFLLNENRRQIMTGLIRPKLKKALKWMKMLSEGLMRLDPRSLIFCQFSSPSQIFTQWPLQPQQASFSIHWSTPFYPPHLKTWTLPPSSCHFLFISLLISPLSVHLASLTKASCVCVWETGYQLACAYAWQTEGTLGFSAWMKLRGNVWAASDMLHTRCLSKIFIHFNIFLWYVLNFKELEAI